MIAEFRMMKITDLWHMYNSWHKICNIHGKCC